MKFAERTNIMSQLNIPEYSCYRVTHKPHCLAVTLDRAEYDRLRQRAELADGLREQLEAVLRRLEAAPDRSPWHEAERVAVHARAVLRPGVSSARRFGALAGNVSLSADFDAPLNMDAATANRAADDNPDWPASTGPERADHEARVLSMHAQASDVLADPVLAMQWMLRPTVLLNGARPLDALATPGGYERVRDLLTRLDMGI
jgi:putative toxin-antitoxin system antitoxin component (TIGR02293 family)